MLLHGYRTFSEHSFKTNLSSLEFLVAEIKAIFLVYSIFSNIKFSLIFGHQESQLDIYILLRGYRTLPKQSFDTYFSSLGLSVAKIHVVI